ncbi:MAG: DNA gyrase subunit A [Candidatus Marsarchaeota archaeon]|nr:DNA gyrase subunit A [Candidatus Marsarchaeota archaeon]
MEENSEKHLEVSIENEMQSSYIDYAMSVIIGRALPDARDGLKPAQRRILYAMHMLKNTHEQATKKSARIVGETIGKYHPHGDMAVYETLVRMAQDFSMREMLVEGQGNMGSIDGDPAAAQRYTEVRLRRIAEEMLEDLEKKAVPFIPNFDNTEEEPQVLPSKMPNLLVNGSSGIAVGVATNILPHNLGEVCDAVNAYIEKPEITPLELMGYIKGPDFPTGGIAFMSSELKRAYLSGRGSVIVRGKATLEEKQNRSQFIITEIPYTVNKSAMVAKIASLVKEKLIDGISAIRDESDKKGMRVVIELKQDANPDVVLNQLYKHSQMQITLPVMNIAVMGNRLLTLNIKDFIKVFVEHRMGVVRNRTRYDLGVATDRRHIVEGLLVALKDIDGVIAIIKASSDTREARETLIGNYSISEKQANAILDMKLSRLTRLETTTLEAEKAELDKSIDYYNEVLSKEQMVYNIIKEETSSMKERFGNPRRTEIVEDEAMSIENEDLIKDYPCIVLLSAKGYMKRLGLEEYRNQSRGGKGIITMELKEGDYIKQSIQCMTKDFLLAITNKGRAYWLKGYAVPESSRYSSGKAAANMFALGEGEHIEKFVNTRDFEGHYINFVTKSGTIKRSSASLYSRPRSTGIIALNIAEGDSIADVCISDGHSDMFVATANGKAIRFNEEDARAVGRNATGVRAIRLRKGDAVVNAIPVKEDSIVASITENGYGKITEIGKYRLQRRGGKGIINLKVNPKTGKVVKAITCEPEDSIILVNTAGVSIQFSASEIRQSGRNASGVRLMRLDEGTHVVDAQAIKKAGQEGAASDATGND